MRDFEDRLKGGHPNSLGNTIEIVEEVLDNEHYFDELFNCYFSNDEVVRLRVSNAMKRICKAKKHLLIPYIDRLVNDIAKIDQASTQWTLAQLFLSLDKELSKLQKKKALSIMKSNLESHKDWIVLNMTMDTLGKWAKTDYQLIEWLYPHLYRLETDKRKSVKNKASKTLALLSSY